MMKEDGVTPFELSAVEWLFSRHAGFDIKYGTRRNITNYAYPQGLRKNGEWLVEFDTNNMQMLIYCEGGVVERVDLGAKNNNESRVVISREDVRKHLRGEPDISASMRQSGRVHTVWIRRGSLILHRSGSFYAGWRLS